MPLVTARAVRVPCDVAHELARSSEDIAALRRHARALDADVIALQEVDGPEAARLVFPDHEFCFSGRVAVQNNGFAIRRGLPFACGPDLRDISLDDDVRRGVEAPAVSRDGAGAAPAVRAPEVGLFTRPARFGAARVRASSPARFPSWRAGSTRRRAKTSRSRFWGISIGICAGKRPKIRFGQPSTMPTHRKPTSSIPPRARISKLLACPDVQRVHRLHRPGAPHGARAGPGLIRTSDLPTPGRDAPEIVRSLPGFHPAAGGRRHRSIVVNRKREIFHETH